MQNRSQLAQNQQKNVARRETVRPRAVCFGSRFPTSFSLLQAPDKIFTGKMNRAVTFQSLLRKTERDLFLKWPTG